MFRDSIYKWLNTALDLGIAEADFWQMTFAELNRAFKSKERINNIAEQKQASFDYILADLIGKSIARLYSSSNKLPSIAEAYPSLFNSEDIKEKEDQRRAERFAIQLKQFAQFHNKKIQEVGKE